MTTADDFFMAAKTPEELGLELLAELHTLPRRCNYGRVRALIARGASTEVYNDIGAWPLQACITHGHDEIAMLLIGKGADVDFRPPGRSDTPLILAVFNSQVEIAKALLDHGALLEPQTAKGETALSIAAYNYKRAKNNIKYFPELNEKTDPDPRVTIVKSKAIMELIEQAAVTRVREREWQAQGMPLEKPLTVPRRAIKLISPTPASRIP
ncbi:MAG: ankyrin repeat domain-containing protein [Alphaproteobacteria bacterium]